MSEEAYTSRTSHTKYMSPYQIRMQQKKALQSYKHIPTIKNRATKEADKASLEAEQALDQFITSWIDNHDK